MAHIIKQQPQQNGKKGLKLPWVEGRLGFSFYTVSHEIFVGICINKTITEKIIRRRFLPLKKAQTRTYGFDPFSAEMSSED